MLDLPVPNVKTTFTIKEYNFTFIVYAYRKVTKNEGKRLIRQYLLKKHLRQPPKNKTIKYHTILGFDSE